MIVNILHSFDADLFSYMKDKTSSFPDIFLYENSVEPKVWDFVIVFESISVPYNLRVRDGGLIFISGEPPEFSVLPRSFIDQFDIVFSTSNFKTTKALIVGRQIYNNWHFGLSHSMKEYKYSFDELSLSKMPIKTKALSMISSNLQRSSEHRARFDLFKKLKKEFGNHIGMYGRGFNFIDDKREALIPYRYNIAIENCSVKGVWTEKLADSFLGFCCPIYSGCPNIDSFFPENSILKIDSSKIDDVVDVVENILSNSEITYKERIDSILISRKRLFKQYNILSLAISLFPNLDEAHDRVVSPADSFSSYKILGARKKFRRQALKAFDYFF
jgi:hypothetical protein